MKKKVCFIKYQSLTHVFLRQSGQKNENTLPHTSAQQRSPCVVQVMSGSSHFRHETQFLLETHD